MLFVNRGGLVIALDEGCNRIKMKVLEGEFREATEQEIEKHNKSLTATPVAPTESPSIKRNIIKERDKALAIEQAADQKEVVKTLKKPTKKRRN